MLKCWFQHACSDFEVFSVSTTPVFSAAFDGSSAPTFCVGKTVIADLAKRHRATLAPVMGHVARAYNASMP